MSLRRLSTLLVLCSASWLSPTAPGQQVPLDVPAARPASWSVSVPYAGTTWTLDLAASSVRSAGFALRVADASGHLVEVAPPSPRTMRGSVRGRGDCSVAASVEPSGLFARVHGPDVDFVIEPVAGAPGTHLHLAHACAPLPAGACGVEAHGVHLEPQGGARIQSGTGMPLMAEIAFDCDYDFYAFKGSSVAAVLADVERTLDAVNLFYERDVDLTHRISHVIVRTSEPDPYDGNDSGVILGTQLRNEWINNQQAVPRDMVHFVTSRDMGNILGLAYVSVTCDPNWAYGLSRFGTDFGTNASVLGHELGHNWSCPHCLDTCDVMCGCGAAGGFGPNDRAQIAAFVATRGCLDRLMPLPLAHWQLDEQSGSVAADSSASRWDGAFENGVVLGVPGATLGTDRAASFDGVDDRVHVVAPGTPPALAHGFSVAAWVRFTPTSGFHRVLSNAASWSFGTIADRPALTLRGSRHYLSAAQITPGRWTHLAVTFDNRITATFYVDGQRVDSSTGSVPPLPLGSDWWIGTSDGTRDFFGGDLDDVQLYDGVLTATHVATLFAHGGVQLGRPGFTSYGTGFAGSTGIPSFAAEGVPLVGREITFVIGGSFTFVNPGVLALALAPAQIPLAGGTLLVDPTLALTLVVPLFPGPVNHFRVGTPADPSLAGLPLYAQTIEIDSGAAGGLSFTPGLRIVLGG